MALRLRKTLPLVTDMATALNDLKTYTVNSVRTLKADIAGVAAVGTSTPAPGFHNDQYERPVGSANASDLPTALALVNDLAATYSAHIADGLAHPTPDATNKLVAAMPATDLASAQTLANDIKAKYNLHRAIASTTHPGGADSTNTVTSPDASNLATLQTLVNEMKTDLNAHMASGPTAKSVRAVPA